MPNNVPPPGRPDRPAVSEWRPHAGCSRPEGLPAPRLSRWRARRPLAAPERLPSPAPPPASGPLVAAMPAALLTADAGPRGRALLGSAVSVEAAVVLTWWLWGSETLTHPEAKGVSMGPKHVSPCDSRKPLHGGPASPQHGGLRGSQAMPGQDTGRAPAWSAPHAVIQQGLAPHHVPSSNGGRQTASLGAV